MSNVAKKALITEYLQPQVEQRRTAIPGGVGSVSNALIWSPQRQLQESSTSTSNSVNSNSALSLPSPFSRLE